MAPLDLPKQVPDVEHGRRTSLGAVEALRAAFGGAIHDHISFRAEETVSVDPAKLVEIGRWLRESPDFAYVFLTDITAIHWLERDTQYEVAYLLYSFRHNSRLRLKVRPADGGDRVPTVTGVWRTADWLEREEWDKVGVIFEGHPNLKRILLPDDWEGHPLRKDYPMEGIGA